MTGISRDCGNGARAMERADADFLPVNVGTGTPTTVLTVARQLAEHLGKDIQPHVSGRFREGDIRHCFADITRACDLLGYAPTVAFADGLANLAEWVRRRVRLYYWKQWKQPRTRRRHLLALGIPREEVKLASRSRKGYWRMSGNSIVQRALTNRWLHEQGVPDMRTQWIVLHYGPKARV